MNHQKQVLLLATGGTIDKIHDPYLERLSFGGRTYLPDLLEESRAQKVDIVELFQKDSLEINDTDREVIKKAVEDNAQYDCIVITHGTSTMVDTAKYLDKNLSDIKQTIVFTGAFRPFSFPGGDGNFNVGSALVAARALPAGVCVTMHGFVFTPYEVAKQPELVQFGPIEEGIVG